MKLIKILLVTVDRIIIMAITKARKLNVQPKLLALTSLLIPTKADWELQDSN